MRRLPPLAPWGAVVSLLAACVAAQATINVNTAGFSKPVGTWDAATMTATLTQDVNETIQIDSDGITLNGNGHTVAGAGAYGVYLYLRTGVTVANLQVQGCTNGIYLNRSGRCTLMNNTAGSNSTAGIYLSGSASTGNLITGNSLTTNGYGVYLYYAGGNTVTNNSIAENTYGMNISLGNGGNRIFQNDFLRNGTQVIIGASPGNVFSLDLPDGGNYWSNWTAPDANGDGFVDVPYAFSGGQDLLPWARQSGWADAIPPTTTPSLGGTAGDNGWYRSAVTVTLTAEDNPGGTGVKQIDYSFDGETWQSYTDPLTVSAEGVTSLFFRATDNAGNVEEAQVATVSIDTTPPIVTGAATTQANAAGWYNTAVTVRFEASDALSGIASVTPDVILTADGTDQAATGTATDAAGNTAIVTVSGINIDTTAPTITLTAPTDGSSYLLYADASASWSVEDALSGVAAPEASVANGDALDTATVGPKTLSVSATDAAGNTATVRATYAVCYAFSGVQQPIDADGRSIFKLGRTVPVKFQLQDAAGALVGTATARLQVAKISDGVIGDILAVDSTSAATEGNLFRYDAAAGQYIFNLGTQNLSVGTWELQVTLDDGSTHTAMISLK